MPIKDLWQRLFRKGVSTVSGQILGKILYSFLNFNKDAEIFKKLYDKKKILQTIEKSNIPILDTYNYSHETTLRWLSELGADIFVVHTPYWIGKSVREMPLKKILIGGHPGLTPNYRGSHSAFWAIYRGHPEDVGCSVFFLDHGVDTGDLICQEKIPIEKGDSYVTLGWKGMIRQAELQAEVISNFDKGMDIPRRKHNIIPVNSCFDIPTFWEYLAYRKRQNYVR